MANNIAAKFFADILKDYFKVGYGRSQGKSGRRPQWSAVTFAVACGVTPQSVNNWLQSRSIPNQNSFARICSVFFANVSNWETHQPFIELSDAYWASSNGISFDAVTFDNNSVDTPKLPVPRQSAGPHFAISSAGKIFHAPPHEFDESGNNVRRLLQLLPIAQEEASRFLGYFSPGDNAFATLMNDVAAYKASIGGDVSEIDWGLVWGLGVRIEEAASAAMRKIDDRVLPSLEDQPLAALQSLRSVHAP